MLDLAGHTGKEHNVIRLVLIRHASARPHKDLRHNVDTPTLKIIIINVNTGRS